MDTLQELTPYRQLGGDQVLRQLVDRFYRIMFSEPSVRVLRDMHEGHLADIQERLFDFLSGWLGGPQRYVQKHGHPRLRARHLGFPIGEEARDQWMLCMRRALAETPMDEDLRVRLEQSFTRTADALRNRPGL